MRFAASLREVAAGADLAPSARLEVLEEVASDLDALYEELIAQGVPTVVARRRAEALLSPSAEALRALGTVHRPLPWRLAASLTGSGRRVERALLALSALFVLAVSLFAFARAGLLRDPSPFLWPLLGLAAGGALLTLAHALRLWLGGSPRPALVRRRLRGLLLLPCASCLIAALGVSLELWRAAGLIMGDVALQRPALLAWLFRSVALGGCALLTVLAVGLAWLLLSTRVAVLERREEALLGEGEMHIVPPAWR